MQTKLSITLPPKTGPQVTRATHCPQPFESFFIQKISGSHFTGAASEPIREVQKHVNVIRNSKGEENEAVAWYVKTEDGKLHGQFHAECDAILFARTH